LGEYVVVGDFEGYLHWFDSSNGEMLARTRAGSDAITTQPIARDGVLYVYGEGGALTALTIEVPGEMSDEPPEEPSDGPLRWGGGEFSEDR
jgi:outer membrane protein assembly factor BamB